MVQMCLGTVQFVMNYGINNQIGRQPTMDESFEILDYALENCIDTIDTARAYGEVELLLGEYFRENSRRKNNIKIISKLKPNYINTNDVAGIVEKELLDTLNRLNIDFLDGYLLHTPEYILNKDIVNAMCKMKGK
ncbi:MAG: hypothetical protein HFH66_13450 [Lachnospiraceae bacterium]|nr:hypothetical protein [Lachnospiraceae bacterium]